MIIVKGIGLGIGLAILSYDSSICRRSALTPNMPTETQHRIPDFRTPGRWKMEDRRWKIEDGRWTTILHQAMGPQDVPVQKMIALVIWHLAFIIIII